MPATKVDKTPWGFGHGVKGRPNVEEGLLAGDRACAQAPLTEHSLWGRVSCHGGVQGFEFGRKIAGRVVGKLVQGELPPTLE